MFRVYQIKNNINGKLYVGYTSLPINERLNQHIQTSLSDKRKKFPIHHAISKYGFENFSICSIFESKIKEDCLKKEKQEILKNIQSNIQSYNIHEGGVGGDTISCHPKNHEIRIRFSDRSKKFWQNEQYKHKLKNIASKDFVKLQKLQIGSKKFWENAEHKQQYIDRNLIGENNPFFGKSHSERTKKLLSEKIKEKYKDPNYYARITEANKKKRIKRHNSNAKQISDKQYYDIVTKRINTTDSIAKISKDVNLPFKVVYNRLRWIGLK